LNAVQGACKSRSTRKMVPKGDGNGCCRGNTQG
jgi:hypothetical protein